MLNLNCFLLLLYLKSGFSIDLCLSESSTSLTTLTSSVFACRAFKISLAKVGGSGLQEAARLLQCERPWTLPLKGKELWPEPLEATSCERELQQSGLQRSLVWTGGQ